MQISRRAWQEYIGKLSKINSKAASIMQEWAEKYGYSDVESIIRLANGLTYKYGEAASALACEMYDSIAAASGVIAPPAVPAEVMPEEYVAQAVRKTLDKAPTTVPNVVGRMVKQAGADTMLKNAQRDGAQFAWVPSGDTCAFCITLASRGWQYMSKKALKNGHAEHIHSNCDCQYAIRFSEKDSVAGYDPQKYADMYYGAEGDTPQDKINSMRRAQYAENKDAINERKKIVYATKKKMTNNVSPVILSKIDECAIYDYMSSGVAYKTNYLLRKGEELPEELKVVSEALDNALNKLPDYHGTVYRSLRSDYLDNGIDEFLTQHEVGKVVTYDAYTSTSKSVYDPNMDIQIVMKSKKGKDISRWNGNEDEVLFKKKSKFIVTGRQDTTIFLEEIM